MKKRRFIFCSMFGVAELDRLNSKKGMNDLYI
jgi:hypothetical protein